MLLVPYHGKKGDYVIKHIQKRMKSLPPTGIVIKIAYVGSNLSISFHVKDVNKFKSNHDIIYQSRCPKIGCNDHYLRVTGRIIS